MPGIEWVSTLDNSHFINSMKQIQDTMKQSSQMLQSVGKNFNISSVVDQYISLTKVIQDNEQAIQKSRETVVQWMRDAEAARDTKDFALFDSIQVDISDKLNEIEQMTKETETLKQSLNELMGVWGNLAGQKAPMLFDTQEAYDHVQELKVQIADLQSKIASFNGSDADLEALRGQLSGLEEELRRCEVSAAENAAKLGHAGVVAAEASNHYYELTNQIKEQEVVVGELTIKLNEAEQAYKKALGGNNVQDIMDARAKFDALAQGLDGARHNLISLKTEQEDFHKKMQKMSSGVSEAGAEIIGVFKNIAAVAGVSFTLNQAKAFVNEVVSIRSAMQDLETSTKVFLGSAEKAADFNEQLRNYSMNSLFHYNELMAVSQQMLGLGMDTEQAMQKIDQLAKVAAATHASLSSVVSMYTRAQTMGSVMNRQLVSWQNLGVNVKQVLKEMGEDVTKSSVSFEQLEKVINHVTAPGGKFANAQSEMLGNISAEIDTYKNKMELMFNEIGEEYQDYITGVIKGGQWMIDHYREIGTVIMDVIAAYGAYRAALVAIAAAHKINTAWETASAVATRINTAAKAGQATAVTTSTVAWRLATTSIKENTTAMLANAAAALSNPYVLLGAAVAALTFTVYKLATAEDAETAARRHANEQMDDFKKKLDEQKSRIEGYVSVLHDSNATEYEKAQAWESLSKEAPSLVEGYDKASFAALEYDDANKKVKDTMENMEFSELKKNLDELRTAYNVFQKYKDGFALIDEERNVYSSMYSKLREMFGVSAFGGGVNKDIEYLSTLVHEAESAYNKVKSVRDKVAEESRPIEIRVKEANENVQEKQRILDFYDEAITLAHDVENATNDQDYSEAVRKYDEYLDKIDGEVKDLEKAIEENPFDVTIQYEKEEKERMYRELVAVKNSWMGIFASPIPIWFSLNYTKAKDDADASKSGDRKGMHFVKAGMGNEFNDKGEAGYWVANEEEISRSPQEWLSLKKKAWTDAQKELNDYLAANGKKSDEENKKAIQQLKNKVATAKKAYEDAGGTTGKGGGKNKKDQQSAQNAKQIQEELRYQEELRKIRQEASDARRDAEIASISNDAERERAEQDEQHERNLRQIEEQANEMKKAIYERNKKVWENAHKDSPYENTEEGKAGWMGLQLSEDQQTVIDALTQKENAEYLRMVEQRYEQERQATLDFLKAYGSYEQQKLAITEEYETKIAKASSVTEKASLGLQKDKALKDLEKQQLEDSVDWAGVFNDLSGHSKEYLEGLRDQLQNILSTGNLPIDQMETIQGKIREINEAINEQGGMFSYASEQQREHTRRVQEAADKQEQLNQLLSEQYTLQASIVTTQEQLRTLVGDDNLDLSDVTKYDNILESIGKEFGKNSDIYKKAEKYLVKLRTQEGKLNDVRDKAQKKAFEWKKAEDGANEGFKDMVARVASNIKGWCDTYLSDLPDLLNEIGLGDAGDKASKALSGVNDAANAAADFASGNYVGAALNAIKSIKNFGSALGIGGGNAAEINKQLEKLSDRNEVLTTAIDRLTDVMSGKSGLSAIKTYETLAKQQKELEANLQKQLQLQMQYNAAHHSFNKKWGGFSSSELATFNSLFGTNWNGDLNTLTSDLAANLLGMADMMQKIADTGDYGDRVVERIKELAEQAGKAEEQVASLNEALTTTTKENVFDDFLSSLYDLADGSEDVMDDIASNWQQMVNRMVINNLIGADMQSQLEDWYEQLAKLNKDRTEGKIGDTYYKEQLESLQNLYNSYVQQGQSQIEQFREMGIIKSVTDAADDAAEATKDYLDSIRSAFESLVSDSETDLEEWGRNLRNTILQNLIQSKLLDEDFENWAEEWGQRYTDLISQMADGAISQTDYDAQLATLMAEFDKTTGDISEKSKAMWEAFGIDAEEAAEQTESAFNDLHSSFLSTLTDLNADVEAWTKNITKTMVEQLVERNILNDAFDEQMDAWRESFENALETNDTEGLKALREELEELRGSLAKQAQEYMTALGYVEDVISDTTFKDMGSDFKSQLMNLDATAEDWAESVGKKMAEKIIEQMVESTMIQPFLDELQKAFNAAMSVEGTTIDTVLSQLAPQIDAAKEAFNEAQPIVRRILEAFGITKQIELPFSDLRGTFVSTLTDMEADAESFGKEIGKTLIEQMMDKLLKSRFQDKLDQLNKDWAEALENGDSTAIESIRQQMVALRGEAAEAVKPLIEDLKALEVMENPFDGLASSFLSSLQNLEDTSKKFGASMTENLVGQMMDKLLEKNGLQDELDKLGEEWQKALDEGDTAAIDGIIDRMVKLREQSAEAVQPLIDKLKSLQDMELDTPLHGLRDSFLSDLMDMESSTEDFADNINKILTEAFVDKFVLGEGFDEMLKKWEQQYEDIMGSDLSETERAAQLSELKRVIGNARDEYTEQARAIQELMGITDTSSLADQEAHVNMADKATYDQFELYLGIATAQQIALEQGNDVRKQILSTLQTMSGITSPNGDTVKEIRSMLRTTNEHLYAIKAATEGIRAEFMPRLQSIDNKLSRL